MRNRLELQGLLENILENRHVYYQPPESVKLQYPAIVYSRSDIRNNHANNEVYMQDLAYEITVIDTNPDSEIVKKISKLPRCRFSRHFKSDHLNHDVFVLYF